MIYSRCLKLFDIRRTKKVLNSCLRFIVDRRSVTKYIRDIIWLIMQERKTTFTRILYIVLLKIKYTCLYLNRLTIDNFLTVEIWYSNWYYTFLRNKLLWQNIPSRCYKQLPHDLKTADTTIFLLRVKMLTITSLKCITQFNYILIYSYVSVIKPYNIFAFIN